MASLLIIGGSGFFGKSILDSYRRGLLSPWGIDSVTVMARNAEGLKGSNPELLHNSVKLINGDISNCLKLPRADYVIHAAASTDAANYITRPEAEKRNIQAGTYNYCKLAQKFHKESRIIYCSSGAVYGQQPAGMEFLHENFEGGNVNKMSTIKRDYAAAKRDAEKAICALGLQGRSVSIARCFAFVGKYLPRDQHFAIGNFIQDGIMGGPIIVKALNPVYRSYMYADELVHWLMTICHSANSSCPIYNVGSDEAITVQELSNQLAKRFSVAIVQPELSKKTEDRYIPCINKAKDELNLTLSINLANSIDKTIEAICGEKIFCV